MINFRGQIINDASPYIGNPKSDTLGIRSVLVYCLYKYNTKMERMTRIELASRAWKAPVLPLNYIRMEPHIRFERMTYGLQDRCSAS